MTDISAFRAVRYNASLVGDLSNVVSLPYDKIDEALQTKYYGRSEWNVVRATFGRGMAKDDATDNRYTRARDVLASWLAEGRIERDPHPALYPYRVSYRRPGSSEPRRRFGFAGLVRIDAGSEGQILPHERTMAGPRADRLELLRTARCHLGPVFLLYDDPSAQAERSFQKTLLSAPVAEAFHGPERHEVWRVDQPESIAAIRSAMLGLPCVVADGHHRVSVARTFAEEHPELPEAAWRMAVFVNVAAGNVVDVLPTHRLLKGAPIRNPEGFLEHLRSLGSVRTVPATPEGEGQVDQALVRSAERTIAVALPRSDGIHLLTVAADTQPELDVELLHERILGDGLGLEPGTEGDRLEYVRGFNEAMSRFRAGGHAAAFFLQPAPVRRIFARARSGRLLPQKSTDFTPKYLTGLVMHLMGDDAERMAGVC